MSSIHQNPHRGQMHFQKGYSSKMGKMEKATQSKTTQPAQKQAAKKSRAKRNQNVVKCYKCGEEGHVSSNCRRRKVVNTTRHESDDDDDNGDGEYEVEEGEEEQDLCEEEGDEVVCVVQRLLCSTSQPDNTQ